MIKAQAETQALASTIRYPPHGARCLKPTRVNFAVGTGYGDGPNNEMLAIAMIEASEAMSNLDVIIGTPGPDGVYTGPADLTLSTTNGILKPGFDREEPQMVDQIKRILAAAKSAGIRAGIHCGTPEYTAKAVKWGFDLAAVSGNVRLLIAAASESIRKTRARLAQDVGAQTAGAGGY